MQKDHRIIDVNITAAQRIKKKNMAGKNISKQCKHAQLDPLNARHYYQVVCKQDATFFRYRLYISYKSFSAVKNYITGNIVVIEKRYLTTDFQ